VVRERFQDVETGGASKQSEYIAGGHRLRPVLQPSSRLSFSWLVGLLVTFVFELSRRLPPNSNECLTAAFDCIDVRTVGLMLSVSA